MTHRPAIMLRESGRAERRRASAARRSRRGFSLIEMLVALAISALLLTASLAALDASFRSYKVTTDSASTHVVSRIVMHRIMTMIRTGQDFAPFPTDVLDPQLNPIVSNFIEFISIDDPANNFRQITRLEAIADPNAQDGSLMLQLVLENDVGGTITREERPLLRGLRDATFTLEYAIGPRLSRATVDMTIMPNDGEAARLALDIDAPTIRLVASTSPRQLE